MTLLVLFFLIGVTLCLSLKSELRAEDCRNNFDSSNNSVTRDLDVKKNECNRFLYDSDEILKLFNERLREKVQIKRRVKRIVGGSTAAPPLIFDGAETTDSNDAIIFINGDEKPNAKISGKKEDDYTAYRGIPFAEPPVKQYRFQRPKRKVPRGDVDATKFGAPCPQYDSKKKSVIGEEDCLFLNVFTPKEKGSELLPVIFWIHGGGFSSGSASQYDPNNLVKKNLVVVTIQYRLGSLGFLGDTSKDLPGNAGLFDVVAALHWTYSNIEHFGGNPDKVIVSGQGSGASIASFLGLSPFTKDLISGIFAMSGTPISSFAVDHRPADFRNNITRLNGCHTSQDSVQAVQCMELLPFTDIVLNDNLNLANRLSSDDFVTILSKSLNPSAVVEGEDDNWFLPFFLNQQPLKTLTDGDFASVPMISGVTRHETSTAVKGGFRNQVMQTLKDIPQFLDAILPTSLLGINTGLFSNGSVNNLVGNLFGKLDYVKLLSITNEKLSPLDKVMEMTTDALFNLPAFLTSTLRSKHAETYLYSYEHVSKTGKDAAREFLPNLPITKNDQNQATTSNEVGNGEDLVHLFDVRSLHGDKIDHIKIEKEEDLQTREVFLSLIAGFAHTGKPTAKNTRINWTPFSKEKTEYLVLKPNPELLNDFRYCEMGLWTGILARLQSPKCNFPNINNILSTIPKELWNTAITKDILNVDSVLSVGNTLTGNTLTGNTLTGNTLAGNSNPVSGLLSGIGVSNKESVTTTTRPRPTTPPRPKPGFLGLGGFFG